MTDFSAVAYGMWGTIFVIGSSFCVFVHDTFLSLNWAYSGLFFIGNLRVLLC